MGSNYQYSKCENLNASSCGERNLQRSLNNLKLVPVTEVPVKYQQIFCSFPYFNIIQSTVFEDAFYTDKPLVVCAPTGSGKTVIFELCIVRLLMLISETNCNSSNFKIVYMAPVKSLCNERFLDWKLKFEPLGILCIQLTGDSENEDYFELQKYSIILTTPEKWDSITRLWRNNKSLVQVVKLLLVDEIHLLNEEERGATMEATLSRMKTIQFVLTCNSNGNSANPCFRFVAASATFPNVEDAANWLSSSKMKSVFYRFADSLRPVTIKKIVIGYPYSTASEFKFDLMLSYKLNHVIQTYSEGKPTLVFCSTRKSVIQTAITLSKATKFVQNENHKHILRNASNNIHDISLKDCILNGIGFHHGGLDVADRRLLENMFLSSHILVLISTSTLSMGVNFPAHLVVIKSTSQYVGGCYKEYSNTQILQMIGRAGRPQFDLNATSVIMTKSTLQSKYESLVNGTQLIESNLHKHMVEHLNAEIVLGAITDISIAMEWLKSTYLYQRIFKNPVYYGMVTDLSKDKIEKMLQDICIKELNGLRKYKLIYMDNDSFQLQSTKSGRLMAKYYITYETMKLFYSLTGSENLFELITVVSSCKEFDDIHLRVNEKKILNDLNKNKISSIRYPLQGKIKTKQMKINCLIQATFGCLTISESSLNQDVGKIFRSAQRISQCLVEYLIIHDKGFTSLFNAIILSKCFKARLWENSKYVSRQIEKIGNALSTLLVNANITTFEDILKTNPREIELILKRNPPFGTIVADSVRKIPKYSLVIEQSQPFSTSASSISVKIFMENIDIVQEHRDAHQKGCHLLIGDADNKTILCCRIRNSLLFKKQQWIQRVDILRAKKGDNVNIYVVNDAIVGMDIHRSYTIIYDKKLSIKDKISKTEIPEIETCITNNNLTFDMKTRNCNHKCLNKNICSHECCKIGVKISHPRKSEMSKFIEEIKNMKDYELSKRVKLSVGTFTHNIKLFQENENNNTTFKNNLSLYGKYEDKNSCLTLTDNNNDQFIQNIDDKHDTCCITQFEEKKNNQALQSKEETDLQKLHCNVSESNNKFTIRRCAVCFQSSNYEGHCRFCSCKKGKME